MEQAINKQGSERDIKQQDMQQDEEKDNGGKVKMKFDILYEKIWESAKRLKLIQERFCYLNGILLDKNIVFLSCGDYDEMRDFIINCYYNVSEEYITQAYQLWYFDSEFDTGNDYQLWGCSFTNLFLGISLVFMEDVNRVFDKAQKIMYVDRVDRLKIVFPLSCLLDFIRSFKEAMVITHFNDFKTFHHSAINFYQTIYLMMDKGMHWSYDNHFYATYNNPEATIIMTPWTVMTQEEPLHSPLTASDSSYLLIQTNKLDNYEMSLIQGMCTESDLDKVAQMKTQLKDKDAQLTFYDLDSFLDLDEILTGNADRDKNRKNLLSTLMLHWTSLQKLMETNLYAGRSIPFIYRKDEFGILSPSYRMKDKLYLPIKEEQVMIKGKLFENTRALPDHWLKLLLSDSYLAAAMRYFSPKIAGGFNGDLTDNAIIIKTQPAICFEPVGPVKKFSKKFVKLEMDLISNLNRKLVIVNDSEYPDRKYVSPAPKLGFCYPFFFHMAGHQCHFKTAVMVSTCIEQDNNCIEEMKSKNFKQGVDMRAVVNYLQDYGIGITAQAYKELGKAYQEEELDGFRDNSTYLTGVLDCFENDFHLYTASFNHINLSTNIRTSEPRLLCFLDALLNDEDELEVNDIRTNQHMKLTRAQVLKNIQLFRRFTNNSDAMINEYDISALHICFSVSPTIVEVDIYDGKVTLVMGGYPIIALNTRSKHYQRFESTQKIELEKREAIIYDVLVNMFTAVTNIPKISLNKIDTQDRRSKDSKSKDLLILRRKLQDRIHDETQKIFDNQEWQNKRFENKTKELRNAVTVKYDRNKNKASNNIVFQQGELLSTTCNLLFQDHPDGSVPLQFLEDPKFGPMFRNRVKDVKQLTRNPHSFPRTATNLNLSLALIDVDSYLGQGYKRLVEVASKYMFNLSYYVFNDHEVDFVPLRSSTCSPNDINYDINAQHWFSTKFRYNGKNDKMIQGQNGHFSLDKARKAQDGMVNVTTSPPCDSLVTFIDCIYYPGVVDYLSNCLIPAKNNKVLVVFQFYDYKVGTFDYYGQGGSYEIYIKNGVYYVRSVPRGNDSQYDHPIFPPYRLAEDISTQNVESFKVGSARFIVRHKFMVSTNCTSIYAEAIYEELTREDVLAKQYKPLVVTHTITPLVSQLYHTLNLTPTMSDERLVPYAKYKTQEQEGIFFTNRFKQSYRVAQDLLKRHNYQEEEEKYRLSCERAEHISYEFKASTYEPLVYYTDTTIVQTVYMNKYAIDWFMTFLFCGIDFLTYLFKDHSVFQMLNTALFIALNIKRWRLSKMDKYWALKLNFITPVLAFVINLICNEYMAESNNITLFSLILNIIYQPSALEITLRTGKNYKYYVEAVDALTIEEISRLLETRRKKTTTYSNEINKLLDQFADIFSGNYGLIRSVYIPLFTFRYHSVENMPLQFLTTYVKALTMRVKPEIFGTDKDIDYDIVSAFWNNIILVKRNIFKKKRQEELKKQHEEELKKSQALVSQVLEQGEETELEVLQEVIGEENQSVNMFSKGSIPIQSLYNNTKNKEVAASLQDDVVINNNRIGTNQIPRKFTQTKNTEPKSQRGRGRGKRGVHARPVRRGFNQDKRTFKWVPKQEAYGSSYDIKRIVETYTTRNVGARKSIRQCYKKKEDICLEANDTLQIKFYDYEGKVILPNQVPCLDTRYNQVKERYVATHRNKCDYLNKLIPQYFPVTETNYIWSIMNRQASSMIKPDPKVMKPFSLYVKGLFDEMAPSFHYLLDFDRYYKELTFDNYLKGIAPYKKSLYKLGYSDCLGGHLNSNMKLVQKTYEKSYSGQKLDKDGKPRLLFEPSASARAAIGPPGKCMLKLLKDSLRLRNDNVYACYGMNCEEIQDLIEQNTYLFIDPVFLVLDGHNHDTNQAMELIEAVDFVYMEHVLEHLLAVMDINEMIKALLRDYVFKKDVHFSAYYPRTKILMARGKVTGTVMTGHSTRTTLGNTLREMVYMKYSFRNQKNQWKALVSGDDVLVIVEKEHAPVMMQQLLANYMTKTSYIDKVERLGSDKTRFCYGLGQVLKRQSGDYTKSISFLSKNGAIYDGYRVFFMRQFARSILSNGTIKLRPSFTKKNHQANVTYSLSSYGNAPIFKEYLQWRREKLEHRNTKLDEIEWKNRLYKNSKLPDDIEPFLRYRLGSLFEMCLHYETPEFVEAIYQLDAKFLSPEHDGFQ